MPAKIKKASQVLDEQSVVDFLRENKEFFSRHPELLGELAPDAAEAEENVVSMTEFQLKKWRKKAEKLEEKNRALVQTSLQNMQSEAQLRRLIVDLLRADTLDVLIERLQKQLLENLELDAVRLLLSGQAAKADKKADSMSENDLNQLFEDEAVVLLRTLYQENDKMIHDDKAALVESDALVRLSDDNGETLGLLVLGSQDATRFHAGQGSELLEFFAQVLSVCVLKCLPEAKNA